MASSVASSAGEVGPRSVNAADDDVDLTKKLGEVAAPGEAVPGEAAVQLPKDADFLKFFSARERKALMSRNLQSAGGNLASAGRALADGLKINADGRDDASRAAAAETAYIAHIDAMLKKPEAKAAKKMADTATKKLSGLGYKLSEYGSHGVGMEAISAAVAPGLSRHEVSLRDINLGARSSSVTSSALKVTPGVLRRALALASSNERKPVEQVLRCAFQGAEITDYNALKSKEEIVSVPLSTLESRDIPTALPPQGESVALPTVEELANSANTQAATMWYLQELVNRMHFNFQRIARDTASSLLSLMGLIVGIKDSQDGNGESVVLLPGSEAAMDTMLRDNADVGVPLVRSSESQKGWKVFGSASTLRALNNAQRGKQAERAGMQRVMQDAARELLRPQDATVEFDIDFSKASQKRAAVQHIGMFYLLCCKSGASFAYGRMGTAMSRASAPEGEVYKEEFRKDARSTHRFGVQSEAALASGGEMIEGMGRSAGKKLAGEPAGRFGKSTSRTVSGGCNPVAEARAISSGAIPRKLSRQTRQSVTGDVVEVCKTQGDGEINYNKWKRKQEREEAQERRTSAEAQIADKKMADVTEESGWRLTNPDKRKRSRGRGTFKQMKQAAQFEGREFTDMMQIGQIAFDKFKAPNRDSFLAAVKDADGDRSALNANLKAIRDGTTQHILAQPSKTESVAGGGGRARPAAVSVGLGPAEILGGGAAASAAGEGEHAASPAKRPRRGEVLGSATAPPPGDAATTTILARLNGIGLVVVAQNWDSFTQSLGLRLSELERPLTSEKVKTAIKEVLETIPGATVSEENVDRIVAAINSGMVVTDQEQYTKGNLTITAEELGYAHADERGMAHYDSDDEDAEAFTHGTQVAFKTPWRMPANGYSHMPSLDIPLEEAEEFEDSGDEGFGQVADPSGMQMEMHDLVGPAAFSDV